MILARLAAACLLPGFEGLEPPDWLRRWAEDGLGGVLLFSRNVESREQVAALTAALPGLVVAIDEEGGDVTRLEHATGSSYPGNYALGVVDDVELTERVAAAIGAELAAVGVSLNLAPVADVNTNPRNPVIGVRSFGSDPELVSRHVGAYVIGLQGAGVAACAKHFPGHGDTEVDSHLDLPTVRGDLAAALLPFRAAIEAGVRAIMTAHIRVPELDDAPATLSRRVLHGLLREELGFTGVVVTDALDMKGVATMGIECAVRALASGADALCLGSGLGPEPLETAHRAIVEAVRAGRLAEERLADAAARVADMSATAPGDCHVTVTAVGLAAARRALRAEGAVELSRPPVVVELTPEPSIAAGPARHGLGDVLGAETVRGDAGPRGLPADRQLVLVLRDAHRHAWERETAELLLAAAPDAVVVETGLPLWRPDGAAGWIATHGYGRANLEAAAEVLGATSRRRRSR
ncbi:MAG TPA: glycoside hydrolase family 3 N-terminal domain-containing protein [Gaiellaceae bacterium]|nr:glycoside hydrolase family 3 N-terminal domain-containing protein [Gaiellaceae bacterium]